ncbi:MAG: hypothetical protein RMI88_07695, partial [Nitrososphaerota archaeon]|nr:hypothetical protein [Nitrososphaerota archaeon]
MGILSKPVNQTLSGDPSPDDRISRIAFFSLTLTDFGVTEHLFARDIPVADYVIKVYALRIGKFTFTNPDNTPWGRRENPMDWWDIFSKWVSDTFGVPISIAGWF